MCYFWLEFVEVIYDVIFQQTNDGYCNIYITILYEK